MQHAVVVAFVASIYVVLAAVSALVAYSPADAWTVWLSSGLVLGLMLAQPRSRWPAILGGGFGGATAFALYLGSGPIEAVGYGVIEILAAGFGTFVASRLAVLPLRLKSGRALAVLVLGAALPLALTGAFLAAAWHLADGGASLSATFRIWMLSNFIGTLLVAPMVIAWSQFRPRRSGGLPMRAFAGGAVAFVLFLGTMWLLFDARSDERFGGSLGLGMDYLPIMFIALVALLWGIRGTTLAAFAGALIAIVNTAQRQGPFVGIEGFLGEAELEVQGYALAIALTGLLIAVLASGQKAAMRTARDWQTRFEAAIGAHRMLAYEWDPATGRLVVTGDSAELVGVAPIRLATLANWLALVAATDRERVEARFDDRAHGDGSPDTLTYLLTGPGGSPLAATDEARTIRDHDGALHRVVGILRIAPGVATVVA